MGWNSWDCFATTVTESQTLAQAEVMARELKEFGWDTVVVDIQWYEPGAESFEYRAGVELAHDEFGRLLPAENRFPSAKGGAGFKVLADRIHRLGLKFGIHLMRGIPRVCVAKNTKILGTDYMAKDIANVDDTCPWNPDMYGVDMSKPGAQEYYDSVFKMFAEWGVDYVKVDDISRPYGDRKPEIVAIRKAIDGCGRRMVLSLSPGETAVSEAAHAVEHSNLWRISDDFWDEWRLLKDQFARCAAWAEFSGPGHWPDADMLPIGKIRFGEETRFTKPEQRTMMNLWAICRSPLMMGGDLTQLDDWTKSLLVNENLLDINQLGFGGRQVYRKGDLVVWRSDSERGSAVNLGVFWLGDAAFDGVVDLAGTGVAAGAVGREIWGDGDVKVSSSGTIEISVDAHGSRLFVFDELGTWKPAKSFEVNQVRLLPSLFKDAQDVNGEYLLMLDKDRLLANFRKSAGLEPRGEAYGGWESMGISGHSLGHLISGLAVHWAATGSVAHWRQMNDIVGELEACQKARGDGYIGGILDADKVWEEIRAGDIRSEGFDLNGLWVPWYNFHKTFAGLIDAYRLGGSELALSVAVRFGEWVDGLTKDFSDSQWEKMLACEHGGMNESFIELYEITKDEKFLRLYRRFYHRGVLDPLEAGRDELAGKHANTQIPKVIGVARGSEVLGEGDGREISQYFWNRVVLGRSYANGGNSNFEHFGRFCELTDHLSMNSSETCNSYNMLKLTGHLFQWSPRANLGDYSERILWNHILASQNGKPGGFTYYVPLSARSARPFSEPFDHFWCCVGTGMENHARYGLEVFAHREGELMVNQFIPARLDWLKSGIVAELRSDFLGSGDVSLTFVHAESQLLKVAVRRPHWVRGEVQFLVNDQVVVSRLRADGFFEVERRWMTDDVLSWRFGLDFRVEVMPDDVRRFALFRGPVLMAAESDGMEMDPVVIGESWEEVLNSIVVDESGVVRILDSARPQDLVLRPFFEFREGRYTTYFDRRTEGEWKEIESAAAAALAAEKALEARTVDSMRIGEMQPERDHSLKSEKSETGTHMDRKWRHALPGGWFEFEMKVDPAVACEMICTFWSGDRGRWQRILVDGVVMQDGVFEAEAAVGFTDRVFALPSGKDRVVVRFEARSDSLCPGLYGCRVVRRR